MCDVRCIKRVYKSNEHLVCVENANLNLSENKMHLKRETQGAFCILNANAKSQTRKSMKINVICTVLTPVNQHITIKKDKKRPKHTHITNGM